MHRGGCSIALSVSVVCTHLVREAEDRECIEEVLPCCWRTRAGRDERGKRGREGRREAEVLHDRNTQHTIWTLTSPVLQMAVNPLKQNYKTLIQHSKVYTVAL